MKYIIKKSCPAAFDLRRALLDSQYDEGHAILSSYGQQESRMDFMMMGLIVSHGQLWMDRFQLDGIN